MKRWKLEDLPPAVRSQVDAALRMEDLARRSTDATPAVVIVAPTARHAGRARQPNKTEARYAREMLHGLNPAYEALTFRMGNGHRYTPDWVVALPGARIECHEVKGGYALHSHQRARLAFDQARVEFPWVRWVWATAKPSGGWTCSVYDGRATT